jgi:hypothetical protein
MLQNHNLRVSLTRMMQRASPSPVVDFFQDIQRDTNAFRFLHVFDCMMHPKHLGRSVSWALHAITMYGTRQHFLVVLQSQISTILHHLRTFFSDDQGVYNNAFYVAYLILAKGPATMSSPLIFLKESSKSTRCLLFDLRMSAIDISFLTFVHDYQLNWNPWCRESVTTVQVRLG